jgi:hypothetical protein
MTDRLSKHSLYRAVVGAASGTVLAAAFMFAAAHHFAVLLRMVRRDLSRLRYL